LQNTFEPTPAPTRTDRDKLIAIYDATDGPNWFANDGWKTAPDMNDWVRVRAIGESVTFLLLGGNKLKGEDDS
jgi:hypothetical protein